MEPISVTGTIHWFDLGMGTWGLVATDGRTYELGAGADDGQLEVDGLSVRLTGYIRDDVMTAAAIGPVLDIESFELL